MGGGGASFIKVVLKNFDVLAGPVVSLLYPLYASIRAIESKSPVDDQQWLTYWVLYSMITLFELTFAKVIEWLPFWSYAKLILTCWLVIPYFSGAAYVYEHFVRPTLVSPQNRAVNIWYIPRKKDIITKKDDILTAAQKYIQQNGTSAFKEIISKVTAGMNLNTKRQPGKWEPDIKDESSVALADGGATSRTDYEFFEEHAHPY